MYSKFNCNISDNFYRQHISRHYTTGRKIYEQFQRQSQYCLKKCILDNGHIDGTALKNHWFEIKTADVFISHSHDDIEKVMAFAGWLNDTFDLTSFIDSCAWGYCDDLLKLIDNKYCKFDGIDTYNYYKRNYTTSHVHTMLSSALLEIIDKTECLIFYNTPQSINIETELSRVSNQKTTSSPWIYNELPVANILQQREPSRRQRLGESYEQYGLNMYDRALPPVDYDVSAILDNMTKLDDELLTEWSFRHNNMAHALDTLYKLVSEE